MFYLVTLLAIAIAFCVFFFYQSKAIRKKNNILISDLESQKLKNDACTQKIESLKESCKQSTILSQLVLQSPNAVMLMDRDANIISINEGFEKMYEYTFEQFTSALGTNYRQTSFNEEVESRINWVFENKKPFRYEAPNITRTGREIWTQTALMPILNENGEVSHLVTIDTDIHQRIVKSDSLIVEMEGLNHRIDNISQRYKGLKKESENLFSSITELYSLINETKIILSFIKSISDETRILGFNASIEASRAGEYGSGFRVITNQIVEISHNTIESVAQISDIVNSITSKQDELMVRKDDSANQLKDHEFGITTLKQLVENIEQSIAEFKSLA